MCYERKIYSSRKYKDKALKVADLDKSLGFYKDLLGFELTSTYGKQAAILYATRKELAKIYHRIRMAKYPMNGASDH